jgi:hypothetical protein
MGGLLPTFLRLTVCAVFVTVCDVLCCAVLWCVWAVGDDVGGWHPGMRRVPCQLVRGLRRKGLRGWVGFGWRLGTYRSCCHWVSCKVQDGGCGCGEEVAVLFGEGVRAGVRLAPAARRHCGWHVGMHVHVFDWGWLFR